VYQNGIQVPNQNRNSLRQFMRSRIRYLHVAVRVGIGRVQDDGVGVPHSVPVRTPKGQGLTYRNRAKVRALGAAAL